jgi:hypothetical protein
MCFNCRIGFEPEPSNNLGDQLQIILTFDPSGMVRVTTLDGPLSEPPYRLEARRSKGHFRREKSHRLKSKRSSTANALATP